MSDKPEIEDLTTLPRVLDIRMEGGSPVVIVSTQHMFESVFPDGATNGDPGVWGIILADAIQHVARAHREALCRFADQGKGPQPPPEEVVLSRLMQVLMDEVSKPSTSITGTSVVTAKEPAGKD